MNQNNIIKLAGAIKPPARKSEIIEALAIRKRAQIIEENKKLRKEMDDLKVKIQVVAKEEAATNAVYRNNQSFYIRASRRNDGRMEVGPFTVTYECEPSAELRAMARRIYELDHMNLSEPSLYEVRNQVRAAVQQNTPPEKRIKSLLETPESSQMVDTLLGHIDKKPLALTA